MSRLRALNTAWSQPTTIRGRERLFPGRIPSGAFSFIDFTQENSPSLVGTFASSSFSFGRNATQNGQGPAFLNRTGNLYFPASNEPRYEYVNGKCSGLRFGAGITNFLANTLTFGTSGQTWNWSQTNMSGAGTLNAIGPDGATSAVTLTSTNGFATVLQNRGAIGTPGQRRFSVWLRRVSGSGDIEITYNPAGGYTKVTLSSSWQRFSVAAATGACNAGIRIAETNNVIEAAFPMVEISTNESPSDETVGNLSCTSFADSLYVVPKWNPTRGLTVVMSVSMTTRGNSALSSSINMAIDDGEDNYVSGSFGRNPNDAFNDFGQWDAYSAIVGPADAIDATLDRSDFLRTFGISLKAGTAWVSENGISNQIVQSEDFGWNSNMEFFTNGNHFSIRSLLFLDCFSEPGSLSKLTAG